MLLERSSELAFPWPNVAVCQIVDAPILLDMDLSDPTRAITPTLDGTVLAALAGAGRPLTVGQVTELAARGSEIGIRRSLARLVEQGTVRATVMGRNRVHELNRDHVAAEAVLALASLRTRLWDRFRNEFTSWRVRPLYASVFGSAARGDGDSDSDIDLLLVHPPFPGEKKPPRVTGVLGALTLSAPDADAEMRWDSQLDSLRDLVETWTGNPLQIVDLSFRDWVRPPTTHRPLLDDVRRDGIELRKARGLSIWRGEAMTGG